jgi:hypothetical protein
MRMPRVRFTVRQLMILVAVVGLILGSELTRRRCVQFRERARFYAAAEDFDRLLLEGGEVVIQQGNGSISHVSGPFSIREDFIGGRIGRDNERGVSGLRGHSVGSSN